ncbi:MAG: hypothetical protein M0R17_03345 [Candidatus Omnitrophica bacterium]|jgi:hypothetical protein|nr:hypothetical protein [Candidatus Omnitrophota bacterium]
MPKVSPEELDLLLNEEDEDPISRSRRLRKQNKLEKPKKDTTYQEE